MQHINLMYVLNLLYEIEWFALVMHPESPDQMANTYHQLTLHTASSSTLSPNHTIHQFHHLQQCDYPHFHHNQHSLQFFQQQPQHLAELNSSLHPQEQSTTAASFWYNSLFFLHYRFIILFPPSPLSVVSVLQESIQHGALRRAPRGEGEHRGD